MRNLNNLQIVQYRSRKYIEVQGYTDHAFAYLGKVALPLRFQFPEIQRPSNYRYRLKV